MIKQNYEMEILINSKRIKEYFHNHKTYIEGRKNSIFQIRLKNNSAEKALFVPTVDGLSVIDGEDGSFDSSGYILEPHSSMKIDGWRLSNDEVAEFYFSRVEDSYRKRQSKGSNVGSIAVAVFREKQKQYIPYTWPSITIPVEPYKNPWKNPFEDPIYSPRIYCKDTNLNSGSINLENATPTSACYNVSSMQSISAQEVGTGFGQTKRSEVITVSFDRESSPDTLLEIFYNTREQLLKLGIDFYKRAQYISEPSSFPKESQYCKRPN